MSPALAKGNDPRLSFRFRAAIVAFATSSAILITAVPSSAASTYVVTSGANAAGTCRPSTALFPWRPGCTLPSAILAANANPGLDFIHFRIGSGGRVTFQVPLWETDVTPGEDPSRALPPVTDPVVLDGTTQPGYSGTPIIWIRGATPGFDRDGYGAQPDEGIRIFASNSVVKGFVISQFRFAIVVRGNDNKIESNYLGTNFAGNAADTVSGLGVGLVVGDRNVVGGSAAKRNLISGHQSAGVAIWGGSSNFIQDNYIGTNASANAPIPNGDWGISLSGGRNHHVKGNVISGSGTGVHVRHTPGNTIQGNFIGTNTRGDRGLGNGTGVVVDLGGTPTQPVAVAATIGGTAPSARNVISANRSDGIYIDRYAGGNRILGNYIGTTPNGVTSLPNLGHGIHILDARANQIGGTEAGAGNVIAGNLGNGLFVNGDEAQANRVQGNHVGTNVRGSLSLGNGKHGVHIQYGRDNVVGGTTAGGRNVISGNHGLGLFLAAAPANRVEGNYIGTAPDGETAVPNRASGVQIQDARGNVIGGPTAQTRNVISGNGEAGIGILGSQAIANIVQSNYVGTNAAGSAALPNGWSGVVVNAPKNTFIRNVVSGNTDSGFQIIGSGATGNVLRGNVIGTVADASRALGNSEGVWIQSADNVVGGSDPGAGNLISGNRAEGLLIDGSAARNNAVIGNYIGTNGTGAFAVPNRWGITVDDAPLTRIGDGGTGNVVSGNTEAGIRLIGTGSSSTTIRWNRIGTAANGDSLIGNADGILIDAGRLTKVGPLNVIAFNRGAGVRIVSGDGNAILGNSIHDNGGLGIDLAGAGVNSNDDTDADGGANQLQNYPRITRALAYPDGTTLVSGTLRSTPNTTFEIQIFSNVACDPTAFGEGSTYRGSKSVTTNSWGRASFTTTVYGVVAGDVLTTTATSAAFNTSEFSACLRVT